MADEGMILKYPEPSRELWGIWTPDGGTDGNGCWLQRAEGPQSGPVAFEARRDAQIHADYEMEQAPDDFYGLTVHRIGVHPDLETAAESVLELLALYAPEGQPDHYLNVAYERLAWALGKAKS